MSWCQPVFRSGEEACASGGDAEGGAEESESVMEAAGRDVNGTSPMDVAAEFECRAVVVWSDTERTAVVSGEVAWAGSW